MGDWLKKVRRAADERELVGLARDYLAGWYHGDLAEIPEECRPTRVKDIEDIHYWSTRLAESFCEAAAHAGRIEAHREMLAFFMEAAERARNVAPEATRQKTGSD